MSRRIIFQEGEYYHLYNRGVDKREIFLDDDDCCRFLKLLFLCNSNISVDIREIPEGLAFGIDRQETLVDIGSYCLMPNHFHLLLHEKIKGGISIFMQKLATGYAMYFNIKYKRSGSLLQGRYKATHMDEDPLLQYIYAYIHLNPLKIFKPGWRETGLENIDEAKSFLDGYKYSSYLDYVPSGMETREESVILNKEAFPDYFSSDINHLSMLLDWMNYLEIEPKK